VLLFLLSIQLAKLKTSHQILHLFILFLYMIPTTTWKSQNFAIATRNDNLLVFLIATNKLQKYVTFSDDQSTQNHSMLPINFTLNMKLKVAPVP